MLRGCMSLVAAEAADFCDFSSTQLASFARIGNRGAFTGGSHPNAPLFLVCLLELLEFLFFQNLIDTNTKRIKKSRV